MKRLEFQVPLLRVSGRPPSRTDDGSSRAAHASTWISSEPLHADKWISLANHQTTAKRSPRSQARSLAQLQEIMHFDLRQEPAGVTDRMVVCERLVGEYEISSGEALGLQVKCSVTLERVPRELRTHLLFICGSRLVNVIMRQTMESYSVARRS